RRQTRVFPVRSTEKTRKFALSGGLGFVCVTLTPVARRKRHRPSFLGSLQRVEKYFFDTLQSKSPVNTGDFDYIRSKALHYSRQSDIMNMN
ncbi:MAG: hypothetical protein PUC33_03045, partial [Oscillospiraceae bacterium]|nr:hypothetical protein [Oscillospiraceae bacterium]